MRTVDGIKVLMMGARRAGKTSVLAGLIETFLNAEVGQFIHVTDISDNGNSKVLAAKTNALRDVLRSCNGRTILVDEGGTNVFNDYVLNVTLPGSGGDTKINFTDANGEFYADGYAKAEQIKEMVKEYDVILIAIDTPYLMESANPANILCRNVTNRAYNQIDSVHRLLCQINDAEGEDAKLVLFVPIKCEKWAREGRLAEVTKRVEKCYDASIMALKAFPMIEVAIVPVLTAGNIIFDSHRKAVVLNTSMAKNIKCSELSDSEVLLYNGVKRRLERSDNVADDMYAVIEGFNLTRPNSWFRVVSGKYEPKNCDQLAYFILHYMLCKTVKAQEREKNSSSASDLSWWKVAAAAAAVACGQFWLAAGIMAYAFLAKKMGTIDIPALQKTIDEIKTKGLWKISTDGIKVINKAFL